MGAFVSLVFFAVCGALLARAATVEDEAPEQREVHYRVDASEAEAMARWHRTDELGRTWRCTENIGREFPVVCEVEDPQ